jgi:hypothetical protein
VSYWPPTINAGQVVTQVTVQPHDLRRTYARRLYEEVMGLESTSQKLGHASTRSKLL